ncbi:MAG: hypothetical protein OXR66_01915 [Candidatus Woesearchaeota archaeon]|nr:hypothetical protein [Candidatus Woesearchaeota archaeon]
MRYKVTELFPETDDTPGYTSGTPMKVRVYPEETPARNILIGLLQSAYDMSRKISPVEGIEALAVGDAAKQLTYEEEDSRTRLEKLKGAPDIRVPTGARAGYIHGLPVKLQITAAEDATDAYDVATHVFERDIGSTETLFEMVEDALPSIEQELAKPTWRERLFG